MAAVIQVQTVTTKVGKSSDLADAAAVLLTSAKVVTHSQTA
jgi:hypothetical protein